MKKLLFILVLSCLVIACSNSTAKKLFEQAQEQYQAKNYAQAISLYQDIINRYPNTEKAPEASKALVLLQEETEKMREEAIAATKLFHAKGPGKKFAKTLFSQYKKMNNMQCKNLENDYNNTYDYTMRTILKAMYLSCLDVSYHWQASTNDYIHWNVFLTQKMPQAAMKKEITYQFMIDNQKKTISGDSDSCVLLDIERSGKIRQKESPDWYEECKFSLNRK